MINENVEKLKQLDFGKLTSGLSIQEVNGKLVTYLTLMLNKDTGEVLDVCKGVRVFENMLTTPIALDMGTLFEPTPYQLKLSQGTTELPDNVKTIIEASFEKYNNSLD